ncbi:hypothetical protein [Limosilactobacillus vaginalis]|uniref:hypothetical protein n=1 Tax=Limosilactobacillus vaginalis TaxID=1633 RepID=UPI002432D8B6|nr:hypothetical protein [Limosilactobacillus vaginalis]
MMKREYREVEKDIGRSRAAIREELKNLFDLTVEAGYTSDLPDEQINRELERICKARRQVNTLSY